MAKSFIKNRNLVGRPIFPLTLQESVQRERTVLLDAAKANNPWLVQLLYSFHDRRHLYIAMEYVPGGDLRHLLDNLGSLEELTAATYLAEMATAVEALHALSYVHR